jgi:hypothetical protein
MQEIRNKKQFIIDKWIQDKSTNFEEYELEKSHVYRVIEDYKRFISTTYEIFCVKSHDLKGIYYLFINGEEKVLQVEDNIILNPCSLTDYEIRWLEVNKGWETI